MDLCALVLEACDLLERSRHPGLAEEVLAEEALCLREELCAALADCTDDDEAADGLAALAELDGVVARLHALRDATLPLSA